MSEAREREPAACDGVRMQRGLEIQLNDGVRLSATLYRPVAVSEPAVVLLGITPYGADFHHDRCVYFATHGWLCLVVEVRGRGNSEGSFHPLNDIDDNLEIVECVARQPFCNGAVAMWGGSYLGYAQWAAARRVPPALRTIVPVAAPFRGVDSPLRSNVFTTYTLQWLALVGGRSTQARTFADGRFWRRQLRSWFEQGQAFEQLDTYLGMPSPLFQEFISHPHRDEYWDAYNPTAREYERISIPILTITGAYDGDQLGALAHYRAHSGDPARLHYLVIGPWDHAGTGLPKREIGGLVVGPQALLDLADLHLQWYSWVFNRGPKPAFLRDNVAYYVTGAEQWRYAATLEDATRRRVPYYLCSTSNPVDVFRSGTLSLREHSSGGPDWYVYDPRDVRVAELEWDIDPESLTEQRLVHANSNSQLVYHGDPFDADCEITGFFKLSVWLAIDQPDTDFCAAVYEIALDGTSLLLSVDRIRARYRQSFREARLVTATTPLRYDFDNFNFVSRQVRRGHRLRLVLGAINSIHWQKNYNSGGDVSKESIKDARRVKVELFHDERHPSALFVPLGRPDLNHECESGRA